MFDMTRKSLNILGKKTRRSAKESAKLRQNVYEYIIMNPNKAFSRKELAQAADPDKVWFDMDGLSSSPKYQAGASFIMNMINAGHLKEETDRYDSGKNIYYVTTNEYVEALKPTITTEEKETNNEDEGGEQPDEEGKTCDCGEDCVCGSDCDCDCDNGFVLDFSCVLANESDDIVLNCENKTKEEILHKISRAIDILLSEEDK